jgi:protein dithiol:quinone oxidoreductase
MNKPRTLLLACIAVCIGVMGYALYLQHALDMAPCPWCVIQRYVFVLVALLCVEAYVCANKPSILKVSSGAALFAALAGAGVAAYHLWLKAHPSQSCGIDPLETSLNKIWPAQLLPQVFYADGMCSTPLPPVLGLSIPQWSLLTFLALALALTAVLFRRGPHSGTR